MPSCIDFQLDIKESPVRLQLHSDGAIFWPDGEALIITDPHFGKSDSFRHAGIAIPNGVIERDLSRLSVLLTKTSAHRLVVLGDFFHTKQSQSVAVLSALADWRASHASLRIDLVMGNHDSHAGLPPDELSIVAHDAPFQMAPFCCCHLPQAAEIANSESYILAGHLHPYVTMRDRDGSQMRLPAFIFGPYQAILPAFGGFTGGSSYKPSRRDRVVVMAENEIIEITRPPEACKQSAPHRK
jgi:DNA ligase-associated metallophosphoesterase